MLDGVRRFYIEIVHMLKLKKWVRVSKCISVVRQEYVISTRLISVFIDGFVREMKARISNI